MTFHISKHIKHKISVIKLKYTLVVVGNERITLVLYTNTSLHNDQANIRNQVSKDNLPACILKDYVNE